MRLNKIRNDVVYNKSRVKESARNTILKWSTSDGVVGMTTERMMSLRTMYPRDELLTPPACGDVLKTKNIPWTADIQLIDLVKQRLSDLECRSVSKKTSATRCFCWLWLEANRMSATDTLGPSNVSP